MAKGASAKLTIALVAALGIVIASVQAFAAAPPRIGTTAPGFALPVVVNGKGTLSLASLKGHAVYLNFFASWCEPCKQEVPYIGKLSKHYAKDNVIVVGIDELESADKAKQFVAQYKLPYLVTLDNSGAVGGDYGLIGLPLHVFIAPDGKVSAYRVGEMSEAQINADLNALVLGHR
jgi:cytochrome c biogenesis protein CcmG, thiol:disulfide interchange protein DsbE